MIESLEVDPCKSSPLHSRSMQLLRLGLLLLIVLRLFFVLAAFRSTFGGTPGRFGAPGYSFRVNRASQSKKILAVEIALDVPDHFRFMIKREG